MKHTRLQNPAWILGEILKLAVSADENVAEDRANADGTRDSASAAMYRARVETAQHYAKELRRILDGKTWEERFTEMASQQRHDKRNR